MSDISVIMYHYVRRIKDSRFPEIKGLETALFREQLKFLKKHYNFVTTEEVIDCVYNNYKLPTKSVLLTFDDGYVDHYETVFPILQEFEVQGSFYIPVKAVRDNQMLDVNKIHFILASVLDKKQIIVDIKFLIEKYRFEYNLQDFDYYYKKLAVEWRHDTAEVIFIKRLLQVELAEDVRGKIVDILFEKYLQVNESEFAKELYLSENQVKEMLNGGMHIGCHGYNHFWWNRLKPDELEVEIDLSLNFLTEMGVDISNWTAAYPYGSCSDEVEKLLREKKCRLAFTTEVNVAKTSIESSLVMGRLDTNNIPKNSNELPNDWYRKSC
ncbi:peptidoglycan/xylan/chitin deacetylase (PgdA/CDA1 family) [Flavobacterium sp. 7E]|uniref:polysaccharide deacetylase family protein n=1 Tax=Flavobacterium sp. 7E TaxID=2735898 RepID=UPI001C2CE96A|nr:polysaccharide deacetylase family protein [Flavobacterium sp. 7E]NRS90164.1 peptidoglycan/xylan/chitin deacetylase (PgdA/CDA1 family) [Flavobacterium sp. 7E]